VKGGRPYVTALIIAWAREKQYGELPHKVFSVVPGWLAFLDELRTNISSPTPDAANHTVAVT
jgi:hypothetical protein